MNVDFADVRAIMANAGSSLMGIGTATGSHNLKVLIYDIYSNFIYLLHVDNLTF